ncbi:DUF2946 domain-containing protein [Paraburkholderia sp. D15]|uniref:DUF2946 domain-containing protein n=1 Tax=Paraburkholderia sp. D15 TaxID=2880218 RepID=UPI0024784286|nr:DUF2946 domain-containing protein [Paraburkholderia sp. D15]WGS51565.1 DUF2946 domain-containing protein [Paraburkholderia sp. D15]
MATLAPTISHTLAARDGAAGMPVHCSMPSMQMDAMDSMSAGGSTHVMASMHAMHAMHAMHQAASTPDDAPSNDSATSASPVGKHASHATMSDGDACGYCSLLAHMPAVPSVETLFFVAVRTRQHTIATRFDSVRRVEPLTFARPRAPPVLV